MTREELLAAGWSPLAQGSLPPPAFGSDGFLWTVQPNDCDPVPTAALDLHRYVALYGDSSFYWKPMSPAEQRETTELYVANGWMAPPA